MSAAAFAVPHLGAIRNLPAGLLYPHQADGVAFLISKGRAILADDMGLGKTVQALAWLTRLRALDPAGGASLVVCPASVVHNWAREVERFAP